MSSDIPISQHSWYAIPHIQQACAAKPVVSGSSAPNIMANNCSALNALAKDYGSDSESDELQSTQRSVESSQSESGEYQPTQRSVESSQHGDETKRSVLGKRPLIDSPQCGTKRVHVVVASHTFSSSVSPSCAIPPKLAKWSKEVITPTNGLEKPYMLYYYSDICRAYNDKRKKHYHFHIRSDMNGDSFHVTYREGDYKSFVFQRNKPFHRFYGNNRWVSHSDGVNLETLQCVLQVGAVREQVHVKPKMVELYRLFGELSPEEKERVKYD